MGQYHKIVAIESAEGFEPYAMGGGMKTGEQLYGGAGSPQALAAAVTLRSGNRPADCANNSFVGRWAGNRVLVQGDYAEDSDIPNWDGPSLSWLYEAVGFDPTFPTFPEYSEHFASCLNGARRGTTRYLVEVKKCYDQDREKHEKYVADNQGKPVFTEISAQAAAFLEGACSVRYFGGGWKSIIRVRPTAKAHVTMSGETIGLYEPAAGYTNEDWDYFKRVGITAADWSRVPASGDTHSILDSEVDQGQERVIVNLDTMEYLDPVTFGEVPTLAGIVRGEFGGCASALFAALVHPERRGGGDIPATMEELKKLSKAQRGHVITEGGGRVNAKMIKQAAGYVGRWRGGHILGTAEHGDGTYPTTEDVRASGKNISQHAMAYLTAIKNW